MVPVGLAEGAADFNISSGAITVFFDGSTGLVKAVAQAGAIAVAVSQSFYWYEGSATSADGQNSGAYIFR